MIQVKGPKVTCKVNSVHNANCHVCLCTHTHTHTHTNILKTSMLANKKAHIPTFVTCTPYPTCVMYTVCNILTNIILKITGVNAAAQAQPKSSWHG